MTLVFALDRGRWLLRTVAEAGRSRPRSHALVAITGLPAEAPFALDDGLRVIGGRDRLLERPVVSWILERPDRGLRGQSMANGILGRATFAAFRLRTSAPLGLRRVD